MCTQVLRLNVVSLRAAKGVTAALLLSLPRLQQANDVGDSWEDWADDSSSGSQVLLL